MGNEEGLFFCHTSTAKNKCYMQDFLKKTMNKKWGNKIISMPCRIHHNISKENCSLVANLQEMFARVCAKSKRGEGGGGGGSGPMNGHLMGFRFLVF